VTGAGEVVVPRHLSVLHALRSHALEEQQRAITVLGSSTTTLSMSELVAAAQRYAAVLAELGVRAGDRVLLGMPTRVESVIGFFAVQLIGAVPAPVAVPAGARREAAERTLADLSLYLCPAAIVAPQSAAAELAQRRGPLDALVVDSADVSRRAGEPGAAAHEFRLPEPGETAFIQCTSGSTGSPKGVVVSHANVAANCEQIAEFASWGVDDVWVGWLPFYHDMGLVGGLLAPLFVGSSAVFLPPARFLRSPAQWFRAIGEHRGTISATPNFGLAYAAARIGDADLDGVDISSMRRIFCGAESVGRREVEAFTARFRRHGLAADAVVPCYGLAEATLIVTAAGARQPLRTDIVSRQAMAEQGRAVAVAQGDPDAQEVVEVGQPVRGTEVRVVDRAGEPVADSVLGLVQFRGPSRTDGYHELPETTADCLWPGGWWNTGDIGYMRRGSLRITGRQRDLIVIRGANYFPEDFERAAQSVDGVVPGAVVAIGDHAAADGTEQLCLIVEVAAGAASHPELDRSIRAAVSAQTGVAVSRVLFVPRHSIPKTTSGKVRRVLARQRFLVQGGPSDAVSVC
jgi:fatty-acyl-CoA synthase